MLTTICLDADDTLWHNERLFQFTQERFASLLSDYAARDHVADRLRDAERRNLERYGYGIKGFTLSMIEAALQVTENRVPGEVIAELIACGQKMLREPIELLNGVEETVRTLSADFTLLLITKGDLLDQERKLAQSGLGELFDGIEIVSEKTSEVYLGIFTGRGIEPRHALMAGNSLKSDVIPAISAGGWGVHVPCSPAWDLDEADAPMHHERFREIAALSDLPSVIKEICSNM